MIMTQAKVTSARRPSLIWLGLLATTLTLAVLVISSASAAAEGSDAQVDSSDLPYMVLPATALGEEFSGFIPDPWSGFTPPEDREAGEINSYALYLSPTNYKDGLVYPGTAVGLFTDADAASTVMAGFRDEAQHGGEEIETFAVPALADDAVGLTVSYEFEEFAYRDTIAVFRSGRMLGASLISRDDLVDTQADAIRIAQALLERMKSVMSGETHPLPAHLPPDLNCDGSVNAIDAALVLQLGAGLVDTRPCGADLGDVSTDGRVDSVDAAIILQFDAGLIWDFSGSEGLVLLDETIPPKKSGGIAALLANPNASEELYPPLSPSEATLAVDCDVTTDGVQSDCSYATGEGFSVQLSLTEAVESGFVAFDTETRWDNAVLDYLPASNPADEALWKTCDYALRVDDRTHQYDDGRLPQPSVHFGCVEGPRDDGEAFQFAPELNAGPILQYQFRCLSDGTSTVELLPRDDEQFGTYFLQSTVAFVDPTLTSATITCGP